jgi:raffinose/stachyose/melibiose transport system substrate-binding protein
MIIVISLSFSACKSKNKESGENKEKGLNVYVDIKDKNSLSIIKFLTEEYKKDNPKSNIKVNDVLGGGNNIFEDISKGSEADLIFTSRNTMIELAKKGLISDMSQHYERNKISEKYYKIVAAYGRVGDKYYGIGMMPFTMEIFYNGDALTKLGIKAPTNIKDMVEVVKKLSQSNTRIPVVLGDDLDINTALSSIVASNTIKQEALDDQFDNKNAYKDMKDMQKIFDGVNTVVKQAQVNKNLFELGNESTINGLANGTVPIALSTSYYQESLKNGKVNLVEDYTITQNQNGIVPVIVNTILCMPTNGKNQEEAGKFIKFAISEDTQEKLIKKGYITGNKKSDEKLSGLGASISKHLQGSNNDSVLYIYNLPKKFQGAISAKIEAIINGKYTGSEWIDIVNEIYK